METFKCHTCGKDCIPEGCTTGYGIDEKGNKHCFACCGKRDEETMKTSDEIYLYLTEADGKYYVGNWPGTLKIPVKACETYSINRRDIQGCPQKNTRFQFSFNGETWKGLCRNIEWNQWAKCRKVK